MPEKGSPKYDRWKVLHELKTQARRAQAYADSFDSENKVCQENVQSLFDILFELVSKGARLLLDNSGVWFIETPDMEVYTLSHPLIEETVRVLSQESKRMIGIADGQDYMAQSYKDLIKVYKGFPKEGVDFIDLMPILAVKAKFDRMISDMLALVENKDITKVVGVESRGFFFALPIAQRLEAGFVPARKPNKLPGEIISAQYEKEYGLDELCIQKGVIAPEDSVLIVDDVLATGGTAFAVEQLVLSCTPAVQSVFALEISALGGSKKLLQPHASLLKY